MKFTALFAGPALAIEAPLAAVAALQAENKVAEVNKVPCLGVRGYGEDSKNDVHVVHDGRLWRHETGQAAGSPPGGPGWVLLGLCSNEESYPPCPDAVFNPNMAYPERTLVQYNQGMWMNEGPVGKGVSPGVHPDWKFKGRCIMKKAQRFF